jgi:hypothetical protein
VVLVKTSTPKENRTMRKYTMDVRTYITLEAENEDDAMERVLEILNTAYENGDKTAYFPNVEIDVN